MPRLLSVLIVALVLAGCMEGQKPSPQQRGVETQSKQPEPMPKDAGEKPE